MAIVRMQKVAVIIHTESFEPVLARLQEEGVLEVTSSQEGRAADHAAADFKIAEIDFAIETLKPYATKDIVKRMNARPLAGEVTAAAHATDVHGIVKRLHELHAADDTLAREAGELRARITELSPWRDFAETLPPMEKTAFCVRFFGSIEAEGLIALRQRLAEEIPRTIIETAGEELVSALVWKDDAAHFEEIATTLGWTTVRPPAGPGVASVLLQDAQHRLLEIESEISAHHEERRQLAAVLPGLHNVRIFADWLAAKSTVRDGADTTDTLTILHGWVPASGVTALQDSLQRITPAVAVLPVKPERGEEPPVHLKNSLLITPFESVTTLYGLPLVSDMDPTRPLAPFFALFFALCLTDAGYGLTIALLMSIFVTVKKLSIREAPLWWAVLFGGIAAFFVGIPFGGWFGLEAAKLPEALHFLRKPVGDGYWFRGQVWNLSTSDGVTFLQNLALFLGITHLFFGMFLAGWHKWIHGQRAAAFWEHFTSHILLGAVLFRIFAPAALTSVATSVLVASLLLLVWGKGRGSPWYLRPLMGLLGALNFSIGLLSNSLSYLRILALGLVTGAIALAVNQVAAEMGKLFPLWLGIPVTIIVAMCGHAVSIALNTLGSFIHAGRLQFIEFFSQFFEGGGRPYAPFSRTTTHL